MLEEAWQPLWVRITSKFDLRIAKPAKRKLSPVHHLPQPLFHSVRHLQHLLTHSLPSKRVAPQQMHWAAQRQYLTIRLEPLLNRLQRYLVRLQELPLRAHLQMDCKVFLRAFLVRRQRPSPAARLAERHLLLMEVKAVWAAYVPFQRNLLPKCLADHL